MSEFLLFAPAQTRALGERIASALDVPLAPLEEREFDGGEHKTRPLCDVRNGDVFVVQSLFGDSHGSCNDRLVRLLFLVGAVKDAGANRVTACIPYLAYARKDRRTQPRDPVSTRYLAALLETAGLDRLVAVEVHNEAALDNAFRRQSIRLEGHAIFAAEVRRMVGDRPLVIASPDIGGVKRAQQLRASMLTSDSAPIGFAFMEKQRSQGVVSGDMFVGDVADRTVVIYDDMISSGETIVRAARAARDAGARRILALATHGAFNDRAHQLFAGELIDSVLVSDSVPLADGFAQYVNRRLHVVSLAPVLGTLIKRLASGKSIHDIYRLG